MNNLLTLTSDYLCNKVEQVVIKCNEILYFYFIKIEDIMIRFSARYSALIDDKGRVVLPAALKKAMGELSEEPVVVEKDIYKSCLNIFPQKFWDERIAQIEKKLNPFDEGDDDLLAEVYENFTTLMLAQNGRINIPDDFMEHAQITREDREVIFVGKGQSITLWNERIYREIKQSRKPLREMFRVMCSITMDLQCLARWLNMKRQACLLHPDRMAHISLVVSLPAHRK